MMDQIAGSVSWLGLALGILAVVLVLEVLMRVLFSWGGTPAQNGNPHRIGTELPRVLKR